MKTRIRSLAFAAVLFGASAAANAAGLSPTGQFATPSVVFRGDVITQAPRPHSVGADAAVASQQAAAQSRKAQAPSSYELHSQLQRAPVNPAAVRAQGG